MSFRALKYPNPIVKNASFTAEDGNMYFLNPTSSSGLAVFLPPAATIVKGIILKKTDTADYSVDPIAVFPDAADHVEFHGTGMELDMSTVNPRFAIKDQGDSVTLIKGAANQVIFL